MVKRKWVSFRDTYNAKGRKIVKFTSGPKTRFTKVIVIGKKLKTRR